MQRRGGRRLSRSSDERLFSKKIDKGMNTEIAVLGSVFFCMTWVLYINSGTPVLNHLEAPVQAIHSSQSVMKESLVCNIAMENEILDMSCKSGQVISRVVFASWGGKSSSDAKNCNNYKENAFCSASVLNILSRECVGMRECTLLANFAEDPCIGYVKHLSAVVLCVRQDMTVSFPELLSTNYDIPITKNLEDVTIIVKYMSKFRSQHMKRLHDSIRKYYPDILVIVGDDTYANNRPPWSKHPNTLLIALPQDVGLSQGRNMLVNMVKTPFVLVLEDDFVFTRFTNIRRLAKILRKDMSVALVGGGLTKGHLNSLEYESYGLSINIEEENVIFDKLKQKKSLECRDADVVFNFFLARTNVLLRFPWNNKLKIGEHEPFFLVLKQNKIKIVECASVRLYHNMSRTSSYMQQSHRYKLHEYARHICEQFSWLRIMRSVWWSVVCKPSFVFCSLDNENKVCRSMLPPQYPTMAVYSRIFRHDSIVPRVTLRAKPAQTMLFVAIITHCQNHNVRQAWRRDILKKQLTPYKFFIGNPKPGCKLSRDDLSFADVVVLHESTDGYENLVDKTTNAMRYIALHVNTEAVLKVDDDVFIYLQNIEDRYRKVRKKYLNSHGIVKQLYFGNKVDYGWRVVRKKHKWSLPQAQYKSALLPRYCNGPAYVLSMDAVSELGRYSTWVRNNPFRLEDVFTALVLAEVDIFAQNLSFEQSTNFVTSMYNTKRPDLTLKLAAVHSIGNQEETFQYMSAIGDLSLTHSVRLSLAEKVFEIERQTIEKNKQLDATAF